MFNVYNKLLQSVASRAKQESGLGITSSIICPLGGIKEHPNYSTIYMDIYSLQLQPPKKGKEENKREIGSHLDHLLQFNHDIIVKNPPNGFSSQKIIIITTIIITNKSEAM